MNAPVPPVNEPETLKQQNQYQASYNQSFSNQPHQVEQSDLQQEQLQTGKILVALAEQVIDRSVKSWMMEKSMSQVPLQTFPQVLLLCLCLNIQEGVKFSISISNC